MTLTTSAHTLVEQLQARLGPDAVDLSDETRQILAQDALGMRGRPPPVVTPLAVVRPANAEETATALALADAQRIPVVPYGAGTGLMGGARSHSDCIVLDTVRLNAISVSRLDRLAWAGSGAVLADVDAALRAEGLCLGHDPWTFPVASVGGPISTSGLGYKGGRYGGIAEQVVALEVALVNGSVVRTAAVPRRSTGPELKRLFIGAEGTLGVITAAALRGYAIPESEELLGFHFESFERGFDAICEMAYLGLRPSLLDYGESHASLWPEISVREEEPPMLYLGFEGFREEVGASVERALRIMARAGAEPVAHEEVQEFWDDRHVVAQRFARDLRRGNNPRPAGRDYVHVALPASRILEMRAIAHREASALNVGLGECGLWTCPEMFSVSMYASAEGDGPERVAALNDTLAKAAQDLGGSMEYVHGAGIRLAHLMEREHGTMMPVLRRIKAALDPNGTLNPGKLGL